VAALEVLHQRLQQCTPKPRRINDYYDANFAIHEAIITLADNRWLAQRDRRFAQDRASWPACSSCMRRAGWSKACPSTWRCLPR
jgi:DNA-binding GntR family transcriptional regulator